MNYFVDSVNHVITDMRNWVYYEERDDEISTSMRLYSGPYDFFGVRQTLTLNKTWYEKFKVDLKTLTIQLEHLHNLISQRVNANNNANSNANANANTLMAVSCRFDSLNYLENIIIKVKNFTQIIENVKNFSLFSKSDEIDYLFSPELYHTLGSPNKDGPSLSKNSKDFFMELEEVVRGESHVTPLAVAVTPVAVAVTPVAVTQSNMVDDEVLKKNIYTAISDQFHLILKTMEVIYQTETVNRINVMAVMFGLKQNQIALQEANYNKINGRLQGVREKKGNSGIPQVLHVTGV